MSWRTVSASVAGTSHSRTGESCQDAHRLQFGRLASGSDFVIAVVADGAGSAQCGGQGAAIAVEEACESIASKLEVSADFRLEDISIREVVVAVRARISRETIQRSLEMRDFACTLLGVIATDEFAAFFQIGDGAIIVDADDGYRPVFWPDSGEFVNMTYFITDDEALKHLRTEILIGSIREFGLFSDGIQRLALSFHNQSVHLPFFNPMFVRLRCAANNEGEELNSQLQAFLDSPRVNERTDDDKTLVLATRRMRDLVRDFHAPTL